MSRVELPRFIEILALAKVAYELGHEEYSNNRRVTRTFEGELPKRKHGPRRLALRIERKGWSRQIVAGSFSGPELRMLAGAYDQGLFDRHQTPGDA
jgi:hypothetical protein